jgi:hypothetical protein
MGLLGEVSGGFVAAAQQPEPIFVLSHIFQTILNHMQIEISAPLV